MIDLGFSAVAIADRVGHESIDITYRYSHLFPSKQVSMADKLDEVNANFENDDQDVVSDVMAEKLKTQEAVENDNKILDIQKYLVG